MGPLRNCCCCSLRGGALAVGVVFLALSVAELLGVLIGWGAADTTRAISYREMRQDASRHRYFDADRLPGVEILVPMTILALLDLSFDSLLVHGVRVSPKQPRTSRGCLLSWIIYRGVTSSLLSLGAFALLIAAIACRYTEGLEGLSIMLGAHFVLVTVIAGLCWYAWVVVLSFYQHLCSTNTGGLTYNTVLMQPTPMATSRDAGMAEGDQRDAPKFA